MANIVTKRLQFTIGGIVVNTKAGASVDPGGETRETVIGDRGVAGFTSQDRQARIECTVIHKSDIPLTTFDNMKDITVTAVADSGAVWTGTHMWSLGNAKISGGEIPLVIEGPPMVETL